jgi:hypothetical protein
MLGQPRRSTMDDAALLEYLATFYRVSFKDDPMVAKEFADEAGVDDFDAFHEAAMNKASL